MASVTQGIMLYVMTLLLSWRHDHSAMAMASCYRAWRHELLLRAIEHVIIGYAFMQIG
jgi:hypothetical protein